MQRKKGFLNLNIKRKLISLLVLSVSAVIALSTISYLQAKRLGSLEEESYSRSADTIVATNAKHSLDAVNATVSDMIIIGYTDDTASMLEMIVPNVLAELNQIQDLVTTDEEAAWIAGALDIFNQYVALVQDQIVPKTKEGSLTANEAADYLTQLDTLRNAFFADMNSLLTSVSTKSEQGHTDYKTVNASGVLLSVILSSLTALLMLVLMTITVISIIRPIRNVTEVIHKQARLDFRFDVDAKASHLLNKNDELGIMTTSLKEMEDNVREFIIGTKKAAEQVAQSSAQLTATSEQSAVATEEIAKTIESIAHGASEQARDAEVSTSNASELGHLLEKDAHYLRELNKAATEIDVKKNEGFDTLKELIQKTEQNNEAAQNIYDIILSNNESASKIETASSMIQSIANQTNLLALNAAIEAARAGEAGRGFSVVAEEIRKLAEQSNSFTGEITEVINELKSNSENAVDKVQVVRNIVGEQADKVNQTGAKFDQIAKAIEVVKDIIKDLNTSSGLMESNKNTLIEVMQNLSAIAQENAAGTQQASASIEEQSASMEEIANSSDAMSQIAQDLLELISKFRV